MNVEGGLSIGAAAGEVVEVHGDDTVVAERYAHMQVVHANLWNNEPARRGFVEKIMLKRATPGYVRTDDEHRVAASFGRIAHEVHCPSHEGYPCRDEDCVMLPCSEEEAQLVMIRVEVNVKAVDDADD